ncbi:uncharacterized protein cenpu isoform 2-T2 [Menidia menidia]|uniref:Centromere protein U n=1 Tax=Menidia menidia TaxID=238744 RepID=A0A8S4BG65_9TELE|nr:unnamed protein product [Menidia menidia]
MSTKKGRGAKVLPEAPTEGKMDSPNLSAIDKVSFMAGLQMTHGNPLHSTAVEEDLNVSDEEQIVKGTERGGNRPNTLKAVGKQWGVTVNRKSTKEGEKKEVARKKTTTQNAKTRTERTTKRRADIEEDKKSSEQKNTSHRRGNLVLTAYQHLARKKPARKSSAGQVSAERPVKRRQAEKGKRTEKESDTGRSAGGQSEEESDSGTDQQRRSRFLCSDKETDEDTSWNPSPKKAKMPRFGRTPKYLSDGSKSRKSSSGSASGEPKKADAAKDRGRYGGRGGTELEVVLDAFLDFCNQYRESVESPFLKQSIDCFSNNVKDQLLEKISSYKDTRVLKRENAKVGSSISTKTQKLLNAKHEFMRAEREAWLLQKEKADLENRLADLRRGQAFLCDIRELSIKYLDHRRKNTTEKEMYGASSLPALLMETMLQQRRTNDQ